MAATKISQITFFSVILKMDFTEFSLWVEIGLPAKMATCRLRIKWACVPAIYVGRNHPAPTYADMWFEVSVVSANRCIFLV